MVKNFNEFLTAEVLQKQKKTSCWLKKNFNKLNEQLKIVKDKNMGKHIFRTFFNAHVVK